jgi:hypothetical protein
MVQMTCLRNDRGFLGVGVVAIGYKNNEMWHPRLSDNKNFSHSGDLA